MHVRAYCTCIGEDILTEIQKQICRSRLEYHLHKRPQFRHSTQAGARVRCFWQYLGIFALVLHIYWISLDLSSHWLWKSGHSCNNFKQKKITRSDSTANHRIRESKKMKKSKTITAVISSTSILPLIKQKYQHSRLGLFCAWLATKVWGRGRGSGLGMKRRRMTHS